MNVMELSRRRRSVRAFREASVERGVLLHILEAARWAPSSNNTQPWHFVVVTGKERIGQIAAAVPLGPRGVNSWIGKAPAVIAVCGKANLLFHRLGQIIDKDYHRIDVAISVSHMVLAATEKGVGTCIVGWFHRRKVRNMLGVPRHMEVVLLVVVGYPMKSNNRLGIGGIPPRTRYPLEEVVSWEEYGQCE